MARTLFTITLDAELAEQARLLGIDIASAARDGVAAAVKAAMARTDSLAYARDPEHPELDWLHLEAWGDAAC